MPEQQGNGPAWSPSIGANRIWGSGLGAVTGSSTHEAIVASHIKPWKISDDQERLDCHNGLPLVASLDALFDSGLISFDSSGRMIISPTLAATEQKIFGIGNCSLAREPTPETAKYLEYHRKEVFSKTSAVLRQPPPDDPQG